MSAKEKKPPIRTMPESAFFEDKGQIAGDKRRWRPVPAIIAACCILAVFVGLGYASTYSVAGDDITQTISGLTQVPPPLLVLSQWRPNGRQLVVMPADPGPLPTVEQWVITGDGEATLVGKLLGDPRPSQRVSRAIGYGGAVLTGIALVGMVVSRRGLRPPRRKGRYVPPEFRQD